jgi:hypothetical protein
MAQKACGSNSPSIFKKECVMTNKNPVVPVFGPYFNGNFGDDLMGHLIASCLADAGYKPRLWRGPDNTFMGRRWETVSTMKELVKDAKCVIFGGGLPFCNSDFTPYWDAMSEMVDECEAADIPIIAISVGSHGHHEGMHPSAEKLVASSAFTAASLRLKVDVDWLRSKGKEVEYIPDIVLTALPYRRRKEVRNILLCLGYGWWEKPLLGWLVRCLTARGFRVKTIGQFADGFPNAESYYHEPETRLANTGPDSVTEAIRAADVVVATGLHIGITALSSGAEFVSYQSVGKTLTFMEQCGRADQTLPSRNKLERLFGVFRLYKILISLKIKSADPEFESMRSEAEGHCRFMLEQVKHYNSAQT